MTLATLTAILADTLAHGFRFVTETVEKKEIELPGAQIPVVEDLTKFVNTFGPALPLAALDGSSIRVSAQRINRDALWGKRDTSKQELQEAVVSWMLGAKRTRSVTVVETEVFLDVEGRKHATKDEAREASKLALSDPEMYAEMYGDPVAGPETN